MAVTIQTTGGGIALRESAQRLTVYQPAGGPVLVAQPAVEVQALYGAVVLVASPGPTLPPGQDSITAPAAESVAIGQPIYITADGALALAGADGLPQADAVGLSLTAADPGADATYASDGSVVRANWYWITGAVELIPGATYYLSPVAGQLTTNAPTGPASAFALRIGRAVNLHKLDIELGQIIQLL